MTGFQRLCLVTCAAVFLLIVIGGVVRATDSGLGCPDWPRCHGSFIPRWEKHTLIEYSHRFTATVVGLLVLSIVIVAWRRYRHVPAVFVPALLSLALVLLQAWLGSRVVLEELPARTVVLHLGLALTILCVLVILTTAAFAVEKPLAPPAVSRSFGLLAIATAAGVFLLMLVGSYVSGAGYGLACSGWPLCNGQVVPGGDAVAVHMIFLHRVLALVAGILVAGLVFEAYESRATAPFVYRLSHALAGVFVLQVLVGAANVWSSLADELVAAHLMLGTLTFLLLAVLVVRVFSLHERLPLHTSTRKNLAEAAR